VQALPERNLAAELLRRLLDDEITARGRRNLVQGRAFSELLERALAAYQRRAITSAEVIEELIALAKDLRAARQRGERLGLTDAELAFYDALGANDSAVQALGDDTLRAIARELVDTLRRSASVDWTVKEQVRARLRASVKRLLRKYAYPPDRQERAAQTVLEQAELFAEEWAREQAA
jgi:type I restriction enzyme R subunit